MTCNVGGADRAFRFIAGIVVIGLGLWFRSWWGLIGLIPLATATFRWCPLYFPIGLSTARRADVGGETAPKADAGDEGEAG